MEDVQGSSLGLPCPQFLIACSMQNTKGDLSPFLHTASDQKLEAGKVWERGYEIPA